MTDITYLLSPELLDCSFKEWIQAIYFHIKRETYNEVDKASWRTLEQSDIIYVRNV